MNGSNSKNVTFLAILIVIVFFVFTYVLISHNVDDMIYTDINNEVEE